MAQERPEAIIRRYLEDAIAAERSFETQFRTMSKQGDQVEVQQIFAQHSEETRRQHERLTGRLESLGGSPSTAKSFMAHVFGMAPKAAQLGHEEAERSNQNLIIAFAIENSEIAMYESLATFAASAGDTITEQLARDIQAEERRAAEKIWNALPASSRAAYDKIAAKTRTA